MRILVTGGAGYIGSHTVVELVKAGFEVVIIDDFRNSESFIIDRIETIINQQVKHYAIDCGNLELLRKVFIDEKPDGVIHFAADKAVGESVNNPIKYYKNNIGSLLALLNCMEEFKVSSLVFSSSCTVYGEPESPEVSELSPQKPAASPYGYSKQVCEQLLYDLSKTNTCVKTIALRYFNPVGAHESALIGELPIGIPNNLVPFVTQSAAGIRGPLRINGNDYPTTDGTNIRDYIHVVDLAKAHVKALEYLKKNEQNHLVLNVGTGKGSSVKEVVDTFIENCAPLDYFFGPRREGDVIAVYANNELIERTIGWKAEYSLKEALIHSWAWQQQLNSTAAK